MIYRSPPLEGADEAVIEKIDELRHALRYYVVAPRRWIGTLRRATVARAVQGSNSIEGYHASVEDVAAVLDDEEPLDASSETRAAIAGYRDAMTYVLRLASDPPAIDTSLLRALHFMMLKHDLPRNPGQWRPGAVWVEDGDGEVVYQAPDRDLIDGLVTETLDQVAADTGPVLVRAAMAHLNLALVHPFSDGNGRMARCVQTLVLASDGVVTPEFSSIEEHLGHNTPAYYGVLTEVAQGSWSPERSARPWVRFCLAAHYRQAQTVLRRVRETEALWDACEQLTRRHRLPPRTVDALCDAARGRRLRRSLYLSLTVAGSGEPITEATATRNLRALVAAGLLDPQGEKRGRLYGPTPELRQAWLDIRAQRPPRPTDDPYAEAGQRVLPGIG